MTPAARYYLGLVAKGGLILATAYAFALLVLV